MLKPQFGPTNVIRSLDYYLNLAPAALKPLLILGSIAFPSPLCLALKSMLTCTVDLDISFFNFRKAAKLPAPVFWGGSKCLNLYLLLAQTLKKNIFCLSVFIVWNARREYCSPSLYCQQYKFCGELLNFLLNYPSYFFLITSFLKGSLSSSQIDSSDVAAWNPSALLHCFMMYGQKYCLPNRRWREALALLCCRMLQNPLNTP